MNNDYKLVKNKEWKEVEINGEIKEVPTNWEIKSFSDFSSICRGGSPRPIQNFLTDKKDGTPWIKISDATKVKKYIESTEQYIIKAGEGRSRLVYPGDLIVSNSATPGIPRFLNITACIHDGWLLLRDFKGVNKEFLFQLVGMVREQLKSKGSGSIFTNLSIDILSSFECLIPPMEQQSVIADILSHQEAIIQDIESLISKYESRFQYLSEELLSGRLRVKEVDGQLTLYKNADDNWKEVEINGEMKEIPSDWQHSVVNKLFEIQRGKVLSKGYIQINAGNYPVYSSATENNGCIGRINSYMFDGEFLTWNTDGYAGSVFYRNGQFNCTNICGILKAKQPMNLHSFKFFLEPRFKKNVIHGGQLTNLKLMSSHVEGIELAYPQNSELELISLVFDKQEKLIEQQKELLAKEKQKFDWLLDNFLSGKYLIKEN